MMNNSQTKMDLDIDFLLQVSSQDLENMAGDFQSMLEGEYIQSLSQELRNSSQDYVESIDLLGLTEGCNLAVSDELNQISSQETELMRQMAISPHDYTNLKPYSDSDAQCSVLDSPISERSTTPNTDYSLDDSPIFDVGYAFDRQQAEEQFELEQRMNTYLLYQTSQGNSQLSNSQKSTKADEEPAIKLEETNETIIDDEPSNSSTITDECVRTGLKRKSSRKSRSPDALENKRHCNKEAAKRYRDKKKQEMERDRKVKQKLLEENRILRKEIEDKLRTRKIILSLIEEN